MNMKKNKIISICIVILFLVIIVCVAIYFTILGVRTSTARKEYEKFLNNTSLSEVDKIPYFVVYGTVYMDGGSVDIFDICDKENEDYRLCEIYCVENGRVYFAYSYENSYQSRNWCVASCGVSENDFQTHYVMHNAEKTYIPRHSIGYAERDGYYYDGKIVLNDGKKVCVYDIAEKNATEHAIESYIFPQISIQSKYIDAETVIVNESKFTLKEMSKQSEAIAEIYALKDAHRWDGESRIPQFFSNNSIQIHGNKIYAVGEIQNYVGEAYAVVLEYDEESGKWLYATAFFANDLIYSRCYVIP